VLSIDDRRDATVLVLWATFTLGCGLWGSELTRQGRRIILDAAPLFGWWAFRFPPGLLVGAAAALVAVRWACGRARALPWRRMLVEAWAASVMFAGALQARTGLGRLADPLTHPTEYLAVVPRIRSLTTFFRTYPTKVLDYPVHVQSHPPGFVSLAWLLTKLGLSSPVLLAVIVIVAGASMVPATLMSMAEVAGPEAARRAAPFLVFGPAMLFVATTADALYAAIFAWSACLLIRATRSAPPRWAAIAGGLFGGLALFCSYGVTPLFAIPAVVVVSRRAWHVLIPASLGFAVPLAAFTLLGFNWFDGLNATRAAYRLSVPGRPYGYFLLNNLAAFGLAVGPAAVVGLRRLRAGRTWLLVGAALVAMLFADVSGLSKGEVERIWLPYAPWILLATSAIPLRLQRGWLAVQALGAVLLQAWLITPW
jgi:hypothetical protein